jgi:small subunit ribosomal protein S1
LKIGDVISVRIITVNPGEKKISLDLVDDGNDPWNRGEGSLEEIVAGTVERVIPQGINIRLESGLLAFIPKKELAAAPGTDLQKKYPLGAEIKAAVVEFDRDNRNMILSEKKAIENTEKKEYSFYQEKHASTEKSTLGNLFKNKFEELQKNVKKE